MALSLIFQMEPIIHTVGTSGDLALILAQFSVLVHFTVEVVPGPQFPLLVKADQCRDVGRWQSAEEGRAGHRLSLRLT